MTWLDITLLAWIAALTALGTQRKMTGLLVGAGALLLFRLLLVVFARNVGVGLLFALGAGLLLGFVGRALVQQRRGPTLPGQVLGRLRRLSSGCVVCRYHRHFAAYRAQPE